MSDNPPAFPVSTIDGFTNDGMTLRDWYAGQVLVGRSMLIIDEGDELKTTTGHNLLTPEGVAASCYELADAMLAARKDSPHGN